MVPEPLPPVVPLSDIHVALLVADQMQLVPADTVTVPLEADAA